MRSIALAVFAVLALQAQATPADNTYSQQELLQTIESLGGAVSTGLANVIGQLFSQYGQPTGLIVGSDFDVGVIGGYRSGSGTLQFKGQPATPIYWQGFSLTTGIGGSVNKVAMLVYGASSSSQMYISFGTAEAEASYVLSGGVQYLHDLSQIGNPTGVRMAYVSVGAGLDLGQVGVEDITFYPSKPSTPQIIQYLNNAVNEK